METRTRLLIISSWLSVFMVGLASGDTRLELSEESSLVDLFDAGLRPRNYSSRSRCEVRDQAITFVSGDLEFSMFAKSVDFHVYQNNLLGVIWARGHYMTLDEAVEKMSVFVKQVRPDGFGGGMEGLREFQRSKAEDWRSRMKFGVRSSVEQIPSDEGHLRKPAVGMGRRENSRWRGDKR
ncbi:MAG: hypothetical protein ACI8T1_001182 [Verrucomicrobiales bacterium]|jgi:hypothetical protein